MVLLHFKLDYAEEGSHKEIQDGTYQLLSDTQRVIWDLNFKTRLHRLLENKEMANG